jgi:uridine kinase
MVKDLYTYPKTGLSPDKTIQAYQAIYFPAQYIHFALDDPRSTADAIVDNDH